MRDRVWKRVVRARVRRRMVRSRKCGRVGVLPHGSSSRGRVIGMGELAGGNAMRY